MCAAAVLGGQEPQLAQGNRKGALLLPPSSPPPPPPSVENQPQAVSTLAWAPDATYLASGDAGGAALVWSLRSGGVARALRAPATIYDLRFSRDSSLLACCTAEARPILVADLRRQA